VKDPDIYSKLRPPAPTPDDEICSCSGKPPIKLMYALGDNPIHCMDCNLEVLPDSLGLNENLVQAIAHWRHVHAALYHLWLDSGEYERWAAEQLYDLINDMNHEGREVQRDLNDIRRCYYMYFQDESADDYQPLEDCPSCKRPLVAYDKFRVPQRVCETCSIVVFA
jgi:predicted  nucleic acid-binding Zn ribbon protein